jgi:hypothetical protein
MSDFVPLLHTSQRALAASTQEKLDGSASQDNRECGML